MQRCETREVAPSNTPLSFLVSVNKGWVSWNQLLLWKNISNTRKHRKYSELQVRIELTTLRVLPWTEKAARPKKLLHRKVGHSIVRLPVENRMCFMKVYNVSLQGRNVGRVIGQRSRRFGVFTRKIKSHVWIRKFQVSFFYERQHYLGCEMSKLKLQKIVRNLLDKFQKLYMNGTEQSSRNL